MFVPITMERDNFNPYKFESSGESSDEKKDDKKKSKSAEGLGRLVAREEQEPKEPPKSEQKDDRSFLQKLVGEPVKAETPDGEKAELSADDNSETDQEFPLESVSADEQVEIVEAHIEERSSELAAESEGEQAPEQAAETAANEAFLGAVHEQLAGNSDMSVDEAIDAAYVEVAAELGVGDISEDGPDVTSEIEPAELEPQDLDPDQPIPLAPGGAIPPAPPRQPRPPLASGGGPVPRSTSSVDAPSFNKPDVAPNRLSTADAAFYERRGAAQGLLVGGIVGYLIGRRRGRIKTEKRLQVVQEKLEKQVSEIQQKVEQKELAIRRLARQNIVAASELPVRSAERTTRNETRAGVAANSKERSARGSAEQSPAQRAETAKAVDSLSKEELLAYSAQIRVGETNLRRVFEANMVDEKGLRRLIKEYQAGHDLRRALAREFMVKELKFERDPTLRDLLPPEAQPRRQGKSNEGQSQYGEGAAAAAVNDIAAQIAAAGRSSNDITLSTIPTDASQSTRRQANVSASVLVGLTLLTIGLAIYAIWLTISK